MNKILDLVLRIFYRLSLTMESDQDYFSLPFYQRLVYDNWIFDMAKLMDIAAIYSQSNSDTVKKLIENVFENDKRYIQDFKESVDLMLTFFKKAFKESLKVNQMLNGEWVYQKSKSEQEDVIIRVCEEFIEILNNFNLITTTFPDTMLEAI